MALAELDYVTMSGDGSNTLTIGNGTDQMTLGNGNNTLIIRIGNDSIIGENLPSRPPLNHRASIRTP